jgi:ABC-type Fe3+-siderophore transport system permease subunit
MRNPKTRPIIMSLVIIVLSFYNFYREEGSQNIRAVQIVSLLVCGMAIGIFLKSVVEFFRDKKKQQQ